MRVTIILATVAALLAITTAALATVAVHQHYSRNDGIILTTRTRGSWLFRCHVVHHPTPNAWLGGGCLPPKHIG